MTHSIFHTQERGFSPTDITTVEQALKRRREARRTILEAFEPVDARQPQTPPTGRSTAPQGDGENEFTPREQSRVFEGLPALEVLEAIQASTNPLVQAGGLIGSLTGIPFGGTLGGLAGLGTALSRPGVVEVSPFSNVAFVGRGGGQPAQRGIIDRFARDVIGGDAGDVAADIASRSAPSGSFSSVPTEGSIFGGPRGEFSGIAAREGGDFGGGGFGDVGEAGFGGSEVGGASGIDEGSDFGGFA